MGTRFWQQVREKVYKPDETMAQFAVRVGKRYLPGFEDSWYENHAFLLHLVGLNKYACGICQGTCPHHGHKFGLMVDEHTGVLVLCADSQRCGKYQRTMPKEQDER